MKKGITLIVLLGLYIFPALSQNPPQDKNWEEVFKDSFNTFYTGRWYKEHNLVKGDYNPNEGKFDEDQHIYYMDNVYTVNGKLVLEAKRLTDSFPCPKGSANCQYGGWHKYTSGAIVSNSKYKYGYFEIYAKLPSGTVFWPAFWLWNANKIPPNCFYNEIDIMEANGCEPNWVSSNFQATFDCEERDRDAIHHTCNYSDGNYHWFGVEWNRDKITWYVDRVSVRQIPNNLWGIGIQNPLVIIINLALFPPSWNKCLLDTTLFPAYMYIDYVNIYHLKEDRTGIINACNYNFDLYDNRVKRNITIGGQGCGNTIENGKNITLRAAEFIQINGEFTVEPGAEFYMDVNEFY
jgi:beta-glucanase (GH16 family)